MNHSILKSIAEKHKCPVYVYDGNKIKNNMSDLPTLSMVLKN